MTNEEKKVNEYQTLCDNLEREVDYFLDAVACRDVERIEAERKDLFNAIEELSEERERMPQWSNKSEVSYKLLKRARNVLKLGGIAERFGKLQDVLCGLL